MFSFTLAFLLGDLYLQTFSRLPASIWIHLALLQSLVFFMLLRKRWRYAYLPFALALGFMWSFYYAKSLLSWSLPKTAEGSPLFVTGYVSSLPVTDKLGTKFIFSLKETNTFIRLFWREKGLALKVGEERQLLVKLKRMHASQSPGAFDFEAWALQGGLRASGYVVTSERNKLLSHHWYQYPINQLRQKIQEKIQRYLPITPTSPWLVALTIGERNGISPEDWQVLRNTGTNHLMAIAGLHIGIMAAMAHAMVSWLWRLIPGLVLKLPAMQAGAGAAMLAAIGYSALAGFSIPTQRACLMLAVFIVTLLLRRKVHAWHSWSLAMLLVLILNPLSVLTESFWLSFITIALIIYGMSGRLAPTGWWWKWGRVQWVVGVGLMPLTLLLFQQSSLISFFANSIAIPWLSFLILPFCFFVQEDK